MGGILGMAACFIGVISLIVGFLRDPSAPLTAALKCFCILFGFVAVWLVFAAGTQR